MENKENCKIVKDLLPSYIDELTSKETKKYIETHLEECTECKETLENMKKVFERENKNTTKKSIKYAKKYNRKLKISIILLVLIILLLFCCTFLRNAVLITSLSNKSEEFIDCDNYHIIWSTYALNYTVIHDVYYKGGRFIEYMFSYDYDYLNKDLRTGAPAMWTRYYDGVSDQYIQYWEDENNEKLMRYNQIDENGVFRKPTITPYGMGHVTLLKQNLGLFIKECFLNRITSEKCNNIDAYRFSRINDKVNVLYVDKETGLTLRNQSGVYTSQPNSYTDYFSDLKYEFGTVTEEYVTPPNFEEYKLQEDITK